MFGLVNNPLVSSNLLSKKSNRFLQKSQDKIPKWQKTP
jgi:hypothetical protein